jgi:hypothetical protein
MMERVGDYRADGSTDVAKRISQSSAESKAHLATEAQTSEQKKRAAIEDAKARHRAFARKQWRDEHPIDQNDDPGDAG